MACGGARAGVHVGKVWWWRLLLPRAVPGALLFGAGRHGPVRCPALSAVVGAMLAKATLAGGSVG